MRDVRLLAAAGVWLLANSFAQPLPRNAAANVRYTGSKACAACHQTIYDKYSRTGMGRSVTRPSPALPQLPASVLNEAFNREFRVFSRDGYVYQSESETSVFERTWKLDYAIGSGANGISFAVSRGDHLFQAPLSYYSKPRKWALSPGFEAAGEGFGRPLHEACLVCHAGRTQAVAGGEGRYQNPAFAEMAIGCENCHGPGELHVRERGAGRVTLPDASIVNPARLPARLAEDICMRCHQGGAARVLLPGRNYNDFRPGTPLIRTVAIFSPALAQTASDLLEHHESMKQSRCYRESGGKLSCITCHDPHDEPRPESAAAWFRARCIGCHQHQECSLPVASRRKTQPPDNCIACHMSKRAVEQVAHSALTDHRIPRQPGSVPLSADLKAASRTLPGLTLVNGQPGEPLLPVLTRLAAYGELMGRDPSLRASYLETLAEAARELPDHPLVLAALGRKALAEGDPRAITWLARAETAGEISATTWMDLSDALTRGGRVPDAVAALERALVRFPYSREIRKRLILACIQAKTYGKARSFLEQYVTDFPEDRFIRELLQQAGVGRP